MWVSVLYRILKLKFERLLHYSTLGINVVKSQKKKTKRNERKIEIHISTIITTTAVFSVKSRKKSQIRIMANTIADTK